MVSLPSLLPASSFPLPFLEFMVNNKGKTLVLRVLAYTFKLGKQRQEDLWEFEASHAHISSSRPAKDTQLNSVSNKEMKIQIETTATKYLLTLRNSIIRSVWGNSSVWLLFLLKLEIKVFKNISETDLQLSQEKCFLDKLVLILCSWDWKSLIRILWYVPEGNIPLRTSLAGRHWSPG